MQQLITKKAGEEKANKLEEMFKLIGGEWAKETLGTTILPLICNKIQEKLPAIIQEKLMEKGLVAEIIVKSEAEEASYFFNLIEST